MSTTAESSTDGGAHDDRPVVAIANDVLNKAETLIRQELQLGLADAEARLTMLRAELGGELEQLKHETRAKLLGAAVAFTGLLTLTAAAVLLLAKAFDHQPWLAALIVGLVIGAIGVALSLRKPATPSPDVKSIEKAMQ